MSLKKWEFETLPPEVGCLKGVERITFFHYGSILYFPTEMREMPIHHISMAGSHWDGSLSFLPCTPALQTFSVLQSFLSGRLARKLIALRSLHVINLQKVKFPNFTHPIHVRLEKTADLWNLDQNSSQLGLAYFLQEDDLFE